MNTVFSSVTETLEGVCCGIQLTGWLDSETLYIAAVGLAWSLLGSPQNLQAVSYLL